MIPYGKQSVSQSDIDAVVDVLKSDFLTQGHVVPAFENAICKYTGASFGVAVNSGTSALHIACLSLGLAKGDYLWTTPISFVASANCGLYCGATIDFVDIDKQTWNIDVQLLESKLQIAKKEQRLPKILVVVHMAGLPVDLEKIHELSKKYDFQIIEDACHALGATYQERPIGSCQFSDISVFSFHPVKSITTGEGGMAVTNDKVLADKMRLYSSHGITRDETLMTEVSEGGWYYEQIELGYNYRLSDIHAALGLSQLERLDEFIDERQKIAAFYNESLKALPLQLPINMDDRSSAQHLYIVLLKSENPSEHKQVYERLRSKGIGVNVHYIPIHLQPFYQTMGFKKGDYPVSETYYQKAISLPCFPGLLKSEQETVINSLAEILQ